MLSVLAKGYFRYGVDVSSYMRALIGKIRCPGTLDPGLPTYAARIAGVMPEGHPLSNLQLLLRHHTVLPYYLFFASTARRERVLQALADPRTTSYDALLGFSTARLAPPDLPRLCSGCVHREDLDRRPAIYLVEHQLATTWVCAEHAEMLTDGCELCSDGAHLPRNLLRMPGRCGDRRHNQLHPCTSLEPSEVVDARWFSAQGKRMLERYDDVPNDPLGVLRSMVLMQYQRARGVDSLALARAIENRFSPAILRRLGLSFTSEQDRQVGWHRQVLAPTTRDRLKEPAQCLAILGVVCTDIDDYIEMVEAVADPVVLPVEPEWPKKLLATLATHDGSFEAVRRELGITFGDLWKAMMRRNWTIPRPADTGVSEEVYQQLLDAWQAGVDQTHMAYTFGVSDYFLQKMTLWEPGLHQRWQRARLGSALENHRRTLRAYLDSNPGVKRNVVRKACNTAFESIYQSDRKWLDEVLPRRHGNFRNEDGTRRLRKDWERRDADLAERIAQWAPQQLAGDDLPVYLTATKLLRAHDAVHHYMGYKDRFPQVKEQLDRFVETREAFVLRRLRWAAKRCAESGAPLKPDAVRLVANLPRRHVDRHWKDIVEAYDAVRGPVFARA
ncbi:TnsD family Tn7-like transposition protein [Nevskia sp.]|uniref:TnsD family Tn7-like transposition protein n=1 Tax=Nevskia sp. TaxID=1929292 RepID=UPI003F718421